MNKNFINYIIIFGIICISHYSYAQERDFSNHKRSPTPTPDKSIYIKKQGLFQFKTTPTPVYLAGGGPLPTSTYTPTPACGPDTNDIDCDGVPNSEDSDVDGDGDENDVDTDDDNDEHNDGSDSSPGGPETGSGDWPTEWGGGCSTCNTPTYTPTFTPTFTPTTVPTLGWTPGPEIRIKFGVDNGSANDNTNPPSGSLSGRMLRASQDKAKTLHYFVDSFEDFDKVDAYYNLKKFVVAADNRGMNVIPIFKAKPYFDDSNKDKFDYAQDIAYVLKNFMDHFQTNQTMKNRIIGIGIGNEPDAYQIGTSDWEPVWNPGSNSFAPPSTRVAADNFVAYYYAAAKAIRQHSYSDIREKPIYSYGLEDPRTIHAGDVAGETGWGQKAQTFLKRFIKIISQNYGRGYLPDVISLHTYTKERQPEEMFSAENAIWTERIEKLQSIINEADSNYKPELAVTEYGFSPISQSVYSVEPAGSISDAIGPNEETQAVYFLRRFLMDACMLTNDGQRFWKHQLYWQYPFNDDSNNPNSYTGFFNNSSFSERTIRNFLQEIMDTSSDRPGFSGDYYIFERTKGEPQNGNHYIQCMWVDPNGKKWGAVWRYDPTPNQTYDGRFRDYDESDAGGDFEFKFDYPTDPGTAQLYKFTSAGNFSQDGTVSSQDEAGYEWKYDLNNKVDENPLFLQFPN